MVGSPFSLCGVDIVEIDKFKRMFTRAPEQVANALFTDSEYEYAQSRGSGIPSLAARFAAKEAVFKLIGNVSPFSADWRSVEVCNERRSGAPSIALHGDVARTAKDEGIESIALSLSHSRSMAIAMVIGQKNI